MSPHDSPRLSGCPAEGDPAAVAPVSTAETVLKEPSKDLDEAKPSGTAPVEGGAPPRRVCVACECCHNRKLKCTKAPDAESCDQCLAKGVRCVRRIERKRGRPRSFHESEMMQYGTHVFMPYGVPYGAPTAYGLMQPGSPMCVTTPQPLNAAALSPFSPPVVQTGSVTRPMMPNAPMPGAPMPGTSTPGVMMGRVMMPGAMVPGAMVPTPAPMAGPAGVLGVGQALTGRTVQTMGAPHVSIATTPPTPSAPVLMREGAWFAAPTGSMPMPPPAAAPFQPVPAPFSAKAPADGGGRSSEPPFKRANSAALMPSALPPVEAARDTRHEAAEALLAAAAGV